jgi:hypothetical protein
MSQFLDTESEVTNKRITTLERDLEITRCMLEECITSLKETQRYLIKLSYTQSDIAKRIAKWPYIVVDSTHGEQE